MCERHTCSGNQRRGRGGGTDYEHARRQLRSVPNIAAEENLKMDFAVAMLDPEFREQVQDLEEAFQDPETAVALQNLVTAFEIADDIEGAINQAKQIIERGAEERGARSARNRPQRHAGRRCHKGEGVA